MNIALYEESRLLVDMIVSGLKHQGHNIAHFNSKDIEDQNILYSEYQTHLISDRSRKFDHRELIDTIRDRDQQSYIILITSRSSWQERVRAIRSGVDDMIEHPFPMEELIARIEKANVKPISDNPKNYQIGGAKLDTENRCMILGEKTIDLRRKEYGIIEYLARNKDRTVSRSELMDHVWDYRRMTSSNTVDVHISNLRKKLGNREMIKTVHGFGYKLQSSADQLDDLESEQKIHEEQISIIS